MLFYALHLAKLYIPALQSEEGQDMAEYALLLALVGLGVVVAATALGGGISGLFGDVQGELDAAAP